MAKPLFDPIPIRYSGLYADDHFVDAQQFARSILGTSKISNSIRHFWFSSEVTHDPRSYNVRFFVGPVKENGLLQELFALMCSGQMPVYAPLIIEFAKKFIELVINELIRIATKEKTERESAMDIIRDTIAFNHGLLKEALGGQLQNQNWMQGMIERLAFESRAPLRELSDPIGKSVRIMRIGESDKAVPIDEPVAEVLRSKTKDLAVGESGEYRVRLEDLKTNGACKVRLLEDNNKVVNGKITDRSVGVAGNLYTRALNDGAEILISAKPTLKDGKISRLFISDARPV